MTTVRYFHNGTGGVGGMTGAPNLSGTAGALIAVLDACLVDGWGTGTVDSVVISGGIATVTRAGGHPFDVDCVAELAGATVTGGTVNGAQKVLSVTGTFWTFATALANQTATGTITQKVASLGWAKAFSGTNLAAYRSADVAGTRMYLRVDDTGTTSARVIGYEGMTGISAGLAGPFPTNTQVSGGGYWSKSNTADAAVRDWVVVGDSRGFVIWMRHASAGVASVMGFGDYQSNKASDTLACFLAAGGGAYTSATTSNCLSYVDPSSSTSSNSIFQARGVSGLGQGSLMTRSAVVPLGNQNGQFSGAIGMLFPNPAANELYLSPIFLGELAPAIVFRGVMPGLRFVSMNMGNINVFAQRERLTGVTGLSGRALRNIPSGSSGGYPFFVDVTGPWAR